MTTQEQGELLTRVGPGTPMGRLMREYCQPSAMSSEIPAGGAPLRLMLLGEKLIAFRDRAGRPGVLDQACPHRCASLFFARSEDDGLRCSYHGWKFAPDGTCLDMPNLPPHRQFRDRVKARAYPVQERNGLLWVYMGTRAVPPPLPCPEATMLPDIEMDVRMVQRECNWLQALEGDIDTSHFGFLHAGGVAAEDVPDHDMQKYALRDRAPEYYVAQTDWGTMYAAYRPADAGETYWRFAHFMFPFWTLPPDGDFSEHIFMQGWVPMDDHHTMIVRFFWRGAAARPRVLKDGTAMAGMTFDVDYRPNTTDWFGRWRLVQNYSNDYGLDRDALDEMFSGIAGIVVQDQALTESMGPITDFAGEHLASSDQMIAQTRRRLLDAVTALRDGNIAPPGVDNPAVYLGARSGDFIAPDTIGWLQAYADEMRRAANASGALKLAAE